MLEPSQVEGAAADRWALLELDRLPTDKAGLEAGEELGLVAIGAAVDGLAALGLVVDQVAPVVVAAVGHKHCLAAEGVEGKEHMGLYSAGHKAIQRRRYLVWSRHMGSSRCRAFVA